MKHLTESLGDRLHSTGIVNHDGINALISEVLVPLSQELRLVSEFAEEAIDLAGGGASGLCHLRILEYWNTRVLEWVMYKIHL